MLDSVVNQCILVYTFASLLSFPVTITSSATGLKMFAITAGINNYKWIIKKENKRHDKIVLLAKSRLNINFKVLIWKSQFLRP